MDLSDVLGHINVSALAVFLRRQHGLHPKEFHPGEQRKAASQELACRTVRTCSEVREYRLSHSVLHEVGQETE